MLLAPYHAVVRGILRKSFANISSGRGASVAAQFAPDATLQFYGDHALGGERRGRAAIAGWFERLHELFPVLHVTPLAAVVNGTPWNTTVATRFSVTASLPGGEPYRNEGMQYLRIAWARIVEDRIYEDTDRLKDALRIIDAARAPEAVAASLG
jgi:ketosteroid isomerase-like protein